MKMKLSEEVLAQFKAHGSAGGFKRSANLSDQRKKTIAKLGAAARWAKKRRKKKPAKAA